MGETNDRSLVRIQFASVGPGPDRRLTVTVMTTIPSSFKGFVFTNQRGKQNKFLYNDVRIVGRPIPALKPGEILVNFNHRGVCSGITLKMEGPCSDRPLHC